MTATWCIDEQWDAVHIFFDAIPELKIRDLLKSLNFKWHKRDKYWFAKQNDERIALAKQICGTATSDTDAETKEAKQANAGAKPGKAYAHGVQVGDIFSMSWGYDQTNVDFFQVVKLCGEKSCRVRAVTPKIKERLPESGMSETTIYEITRDILEPNGYSVFIKDQVNGDLKRIEKSGDRVRINMHGHFADIEPQGEVRHFSSWWA